MITEAIQGETVNSYTPQQGYDLLVSAYNYSLHFGNADSRSMISDARIDIVMKTRDLVIDQEGHMANYDRWAEVYRLKQRLGEK